ncbi:nucleotidyltransferase domain-containing protein [Brevibacterium sp. JNUCC-42]|nr:nucleotidyltransferase domain-containing protein [Brevibacterium sp. JNUCC-42]
MSDWEKRLILKVYAGSISYRTNTKKSDEDFRGICIPDKNVLLGLHTFETKEKRESGELDDVTYSLHKFVQLALQNNPNILDALFVANNHVVFINEFGKELREIRKEFISKQAYKTYGGYAITAYDES